MDLSPDAALDLHLDGMQAQFEALDDGNLRYGGQNSPCCFRKEFSLPMSKSALIHLKVNECTYLHHRMTGRLRMRH